MLALTRLQLVEYIDEKHSTFVALKAIDGIKLSFAFQKKLNLEGAQQLEDAWEAKRAKYILHK